MIGRRQALYATMALGKHTRSNDVELGNPSLQLCSTRGWMTSRVKCRHCPLTAYTVGLRWVGVVCYHRP